MVTVLRDGGLRFVIFSNDHEPAHLHVFGDGQAKVDIAGSAPRLVWAEDMKRGDIRRAMAVVAQRHQHFLSQWRIIHG